MAYIGYSEQIPLFVKLLVDEFGNDYEGDSYIDYFEKIKSFLNDYISSEELLEFFDKSNFCIFELDHLIKNINELIQNNISYKQKLNKFIDENIDLEPLENRIISLKALSLLFDDFIDIYSEDIFDYESFYISIFGVFINSSQSKFMEFINDVMKYNSLTFEDFYFLINFLKDMVEFKYLNKYLKEFILYSEDYLDSIDDSFEHLSILIFLTFKLNKKFSDLCKNPKNDFWSKDKNFIIVILKLFSNYCREYNLVFIDQIDEQNKKFIENRDIIYIFLKYLTEFIINKEDCNVILSVYSRLMFDYKDYESVKKVTKIVKYLVSPVFRTEDLNFLISSNDSQDVINVLSFSFLVHVNYVDLFVRRCGKRGFSKEIGLYVLKLILSEDINCKKSYFIYFVEKLYKYLMGDLIYEDGNSLFNYLLWITNDIVNSDVSVKGLGIILSLLINNKVHNNQMYKLIRNIINKISYEFTYSFEGISFYESILSNKDKVYYGKIDREYFYAKNVLNKAFDELEILKEKEEFTRLIIGYFKDVNALNREEYYKFLLNNKYFDVYKFEVLDDIQNCNISEEILKRECDFLIYNSPDEEGLKFGLVLSLIFNEGFYENIYRELVFKVSYGDIFMKIQEKFNCFDVKEIFDSHKSCVFLVKWGIESSKKSSLTNLREITFRNLKNYYKKLNIYGFVYIIVLYEYLEKREVFNDVNSNTFKIKTIIKLINEETDENVTEDEFIYRIFNKCLDVYTKSFVSLTQFEILESLREIIENKYVKFNFDILHKDIELDNLNSGEDVEKYNLKFKYGEVLKKINKAFKSSQADEYYENIFISQNIDLIMDILTNETKFYNETMDLFYKFINGYDNFNIINEIYKKSLENMFIGKVFIKLIANYPNIMLNILRKPDVLNIYSEILECSF